MWRSKPQGIRTVSKRVFCQETAGSTRIPRPFPETIRAFPSVERVKRTRGADGAVGSASPGQLSKLGPAATELCPAAEVLNGQALDRAGGPVSGRRPVVPVEPLGGKLVLERVLALPVEARQVAQLGLRHELGEPQDGQLAAPGEQHGHVRGDFLQFAAGLRTQVEDEKPSGVGLLIAQEAERVRMSALRRRPLASFVPSPGQKANPKGAKASAWRAGLTATEAENLQRIAGAGEIDGRAALRKVLGVGSEASASAVYSKLAKRCEELAGRPVLRVASEGQPRGKYGQLRD